MFPNTGMRISVNGTADYSKNNYSFLSPFQEGLVVKRTHDVYRNLTGDIGVEFTKLWFDNLALNVGYTNIYDEVQGGLMTIQNRTTDLLVHIITYNIDIKHNSCSEFLCVIVIIIPSSPFSFKRYLLEYVRKCVFYDQVCD